MIVRSEGRRMSVSGFLPFSHLRARSSRKLICNTMEVEEEEEEEEVNVLLDFTE